MNKKEYDKKYRQENKERLREYHRNYRKNNPAYYNKHNERTRKDWQNLKKTIFERYFGEDAKCAKCGIGDVRVLQLHHYNGGGNKHREEVTGGVYNGGSKFYYWIKKNNFPKLPLEPVCANCHILIRYETPTKRFENDEHKKVGCISK